jgi:hypothetical protein
VEVGDGVGQHETTDLAIVGLFELDVVVGRAVEADDPAGVALGSPGCSALGQPGLPFGSAAASSKSSLANFTALSSASSSLTL